MYATDNIDEYERLKEKEGENNIIFTNRKAREINDDTQPYPNSSSYYHVIVHGSTGSSEEGKMRVDFRKKFCFCQECRSQPIVPDIGCRCKYKDFIGETESFERDAATEKNDKLVDKLIAFIDVPTSEQLNNHFVGNDLKIFAKILDININKDIKRRDRKKLAPLKADIVDYLVLRFNLNNWDATKNIIKENWEKKKTQQ